MKDTINSIFKKFKLPQIEKFLEISIVRVNSKNHIAFELRVEGSIPVVFDIMEHGLIVFIEGSHQPWIESSFTAANNPSELNQLEEDILAVFCNYYLVEKRGGKTIYLHIFDKDRNYRGASSNVNFPSLSWGKRTFELYQPLVEGIKKKLQTK